MDIMILDKDWGGCHVNIDFHKIDLFPRITISDLTGCLVLNMGFLMLTFNLCVYGQEMREFSRKLRTGEIEKEMKEQIKKLEELVSTEREKAEKKKDDTL